MEHFVHIVTESLLALLRDVDLGKGLTSLFKVIVDFLFAQLPDANLVI
jgi:hypothetical protein